MPLPNFVIIGAQKAGTTSLFQFLARHPEVGVPSKKELRFFAMRQVWTRGTDWYARQFPDQPVRGEASPQYTWAPWIKNVPERMAAVLPEAKLIYIVRDPVDRVVSQYIDWSDQFLEWAPLAEALRGVERPHRYLETGAYASQLDLYLERYAPERILVLAMEDLARAPASSMAGVYEFLGLSPVTDAQAWRTRHNNRVEKRRPPRWMRALVTPAVRKEIHHPRYLSLRAVETIKKHIRRLGTEVRAELPPDIEAHLAEIYQPEVERLRALTGQRFDCWTRYA